MATFKMCVQKRRKDGFWPVYIRVTNNRTVQYIKTDKMITDRQLTKSKEIKDPLVMQYCSQKILEYNEAVNKIDSRRWTAKDIVTYLQDKSNEISFSDYARKYIDRMIDRGQQRNARNYSLALSNLELFFRSNQINFSQLTSNVVNRWIATLAQTHRAKEMYPICIRQIFRTAVNEINDYDNGILRITTNPWVRVKIPKADCAEKLAITPEECRAFFACPLPESRMKLPLNEMAKDVAMLVLCLGGINTVDLYNMQRDDYYDGIIHYHRAKTAKSRADNAYMEMRVPEILLPIFEKYSNPDTSDGHLFSFYRKMTSSDSFCANVNIGIKQVCKLLNIPRNRWYSVYTFRHTWGTVAQNDCGASISEVSFGMNHSTGNAVTRGYIKIDYSPAWILNEKVVNFIFFSDEPSARNQAAKQTRFRISPKYMVHAEGYYSGSKVAELQDAGFNNKDEIISEIGKRLPSYIPQRAMILIKIKNLDTETEAVYQRMKGKGI